MLIYNFLTFMTAQAGTSMLCMSKMCIPACAWPRRNAYAVYAYIAVHAYVIQYMFPSSVTKCSRLYCSDWFIMDDNCA
jgi:hypothetical protein